MSLLNILQYPDPRLRAHAEPVVDFNAQLQTFASDLLATMYDAPGIGLAAIQVNVQLKIIAIDISETNDSPHIFVNPELTLSGEQVETEEGCLSVPGFYEPLTRYEKVIVNAQKTTGEAFSLAAEGLLAVCIQHECDHLEGKLFVDYLSGLKRNRIKKKLMKLQNPLPQKHRT